MNLSEVPDLVAWPETHYVFIEAVGPFQTNAPQAWQKLHAILPQLAEKNKITGFVSLYKAGPNIYRAGVSVEAPPETLPTELKYEQLHGGKYSRFVLTGPYSELPRACGRVFEIVNEKKIQMRDDYCIEHYVNNPNTTPDQNQLITEILIPTI